LEPEAVAKIVNVIEKDFGKDYLQVRVYKTTSKNAQEAHEAVRPTNQPMLAPVQHQTKNSSIHSFVRARSLRKWQALE